MLKLIEDHLTLKVKAPILHKFNALKSKINETNHLTT